MKLSRRLSKGIAQILGSLEVKIAEKRKLQMTQIGPWGTRMIRGFVT